MRKLLFGVFLALQGFAASALAWGTPDILAARVADLAGQLSEHPAGLGPPCADRAA